MKKNAEEVQTKVLSLVHENNLSVVSAVVDDDICSTAVGGNTKDVAAGVSSLVRRLVEEIGETDTIAAIFDGFYKADVSVDNLNIALTAMKMWNQFKKEGMQ